MMLMIEPARPLMTKPEIPGMNTASELMTKPTSELISIIYLILNGLRKIMIL